MITYDDQNRVLGEYDEQKRKQGLWKKYHANDTLCMEATYTDGIADGLCKFYHDNGFVRCEVTFVNGIKEGIERDWFENGQISCEHSFSNDVINGCGKSWYRTGQLQYSFFGINGEQEGEEIWSDYNPSKGWFNIHIIDKLEESTEGIFKKIKDLLKKFLYS